MAFFVEKFGEMYLLKKYLWKSFVERNKSSNFARFLDKNMHYFICPFKLASSETWYPNPDGLEPEEVLSKMTERDFLTQNQMIVYKDEHLDHVYSHHYVQQPADGITLVKIANRVVDDNDVQFWHKTPLEHRLFATVMLMSIKGLICFYLEENTAAFQHAEDLITIISHSLNETLARENQKCWIEPSKHIHRQSDTLRVMYACSMMYNQKSKGQDINEGIIPVTEFDERALKMSKLFVCTLTDARRTAMVMSTLYSLSKDKTNPKVKLGILRAAMDAQVMERPSYRNYIEVFDCGDLVSKKNYTYYTDPKYCGYQKDGLYDNAKKAFLKIKTKNL